MKLSKKERVLAYKKYLDLIRNGKINPFSEPSDLPYQEKGLCFMLPCVHFEMSPRLVRRKFEESNRLVLNATREIFPEFGSWCQDNGIESSVLFKDDDERIKCLVWCIRELKVKANSLAPPSPLIPCGYCGDSIDVIKENITNVKLSLCAHCLREFHN